MDFNTIDGETLGRRKDRRVSFAETTAVRFFDRDDSSGTPPKSDSSARLSPHSDSGDDGSSRDSREVGDDLDDDDQEYEDGLAVPPVRFIRDMIDSSPGSASAASVASNDGSSLLNNLFIFSPIFSLLNTHTHTQTQLFCSKNGCF